MQRGALSTGAIANARKVLSSSMAGWFLSGGARWFTTAGIASSLAMRVSYANLSSSVVSALSFAVLDVLPMTYFSFAFYFKLRAVFSILGSKRSSSTWSDLVITKIKRVKHRSQKTGSKFGGVESTKNKFCSFQ